MKFIAHRGYSRSFHENTLSAFKAVIDHPACGKKVMGIEFDIHLTADGRIPVLHDTVVTDDSGKHHPVADYSLDDLRKMFQRLHGRNSPVVVPEIESVLALVAHKIEINLEIKTGNYNLTRFITTLSSVLEKYQPCNDVVISSFSYDILEYVRRHVSLSELRYGFIFNSIDALQSVPQGVRNRFDLLHPWYKTVLNSPDYFTANGPSLRCWTVNTITEINDLITISRTLPIEAIMTDDIDLVDKCMDG